MRLRKLVFAVLVAAIAAIGVVASASANEGPIFRAPDPQSTNVPTVGWVGQTLRVAKCLRFEGGPIDAATADSLNISLNISVPGSFLIEDWSGLNTNWAQWQTGGDPRLATSPVRITNRGICWAANMVSPKPGLAVWKLSVEVKALLSLALALEGKGIGLEISLDDIALLDDIVLEHQGLAVFMEEAGVTMVEVPATGPGESHHVGDPAGDGVFQPPYDCSAYLNGDASADDRFIAPLHENLFCVFGLVKINVKGSFPLGNNFSGIVAGDVVTLPDQWADLANGMAIDENRSRPGSAADRWDIHDDQNPGDGLFTWHPYDGKAPYGGELPDHHVNSICYPTPTNDATDAVDNCLGGPEWGKFSSIYGGTFPTIGPFDAVRPGETLLSNGVLDAGDAPMPSLPVEVFLGADSIGALKKVDKADIYTVLGPHAGQGSPAGPPDAGIVGHEYPHNLYAPFYKAFIPAATAGLDFRTGPYQAGTNNFPGYIEDGKYDYWNTFNKTFRNGFNGCYDVKGNDIPMPTGADKVEVYTDEHGEAWVKFFPYRGLFLEPDLNGLCDIYNGGKALYGEADITAAPYYPGQPVFTPGFQWGSASVHKVAYHHANKTLVCVPKARNVAFCVETVVDYNGDPIPGVKVKFTTSGDAANMRAASIKYSDELDTTTQDVIVSGGNEDFVIAKTGVTGQAGVEIVHSQDVCIDVTAENLDTQNGGFGILRFFEFNPHTGTACGGSTPPPPTPPVNPTPPPSGNGGGTPPPAPTGGSSQSTVVSLGGPVIQAQPVLSPTKTAVIASTNAKLFSVKVLQTKLGRFLVVNVKASKGAAKQKVLFLVKRNGKLVKKWKMVPAAKLRIQILGKNGNVLRTITRTVPVNKAYKISNLKLPKAAVSVRTSVKA
jgi:hypothetical protein